MISFTKRYVNFISLIISIVIFCFLNNQILNEKIQIQNFSVSSKVQQISRDLENENNQQVSVSKQNKNKQQENQPIAVNTNNQDKKKETNNAKKQENNQNKNSDLIWHLKFRQLT